MSALPVAKILWAPTNSAHYNHLHVEGPHVDGTLEEDCTPVWTPAVREIWDALSAEFPGWSNMGVFNCRNIAGTNIPSQHAFSNAIDIGPYYGVEEQLPFYNFLKEDSMPDVGAVEGVDPVFDAVWKEMQAEGVFSQYTDPDDKPRMEELAAFLSRYTSHVVKDEIRKAVAGLPTSSGLSKAEVVAIIESAKITVG